MEVLPQDEVFVTVAVEIAGGHAERGRALGGRGQRGGLEAGRPIQPCGVAQCVHVQPQFRVQAADEIREGGGGELPVRDAEERRESAGDGESIPAAQGPPRAGVPPGFDEVQDAVAVHVAVDDRIGGGHVEVRAPARRGEVGSSVPVEIRGGETVPAPGEAGEPERFAHVGETALIVAEEADAAPLQREGDVGIAIEVVVREQGGGDESEARKGEGALRVDAQGVAIADQQAGIDRGGVGAGGDAPAQEEVEIAVAVDVGLGERAGRGGGLAGCGAGGVDERGCRRGRAERRRDDRGNGRGLRGRGPPRTRSRR